MYGNCIPWWCVSAIAARALGCAQVADLEECVKERGGLTINLGTDGLFDQTSLSGINLYPQVWDHLAHIRNLSHHPYEFYQK
jgi:aminoglycoside 6'-N-acetyltransferase I